MAEEQKVIDVVLDKFTGFINDSALLDLARRFSETYTDLAKTSTEHFLVTPVTALPTGKEKGKFLSIDVGGTNLRVGFIELLGELEQPSQGGTRNGQKPVSKVVRSHDKSWPIEEHLKMDQAEDLFAWIGDCIAEVIKDAVDANEFVQSPFGEELLLGITFSFPMAQTRLTEATLLSMGKGFGITSNLNLGDMLLAGYNRHLESPSSSKTDNHHRFCLPRLRIAAITNDTVATFASLAYAVKAAPNSRVAMGLIVGTGTNATVPMPLSYLHPSKIAALADPSAVQSVVINTEWTIRGTDKPLNDLNLKTQWDQRLDAESDAPGFQPFEYMTAGRYLGEIVRLVFIDIVVYETKEDSEDTIPPPELFLPEALLRKNALSTRVLSELTALSDKDSRLSMLESRYPRESFWTEERVTELVHIASAVQQRSSALIAAACVGLLASVGDIRIDVRDDAAQQNGGSVNSTNLGEPEVEELVIAYCGSTISQYPGWLVTCQRLIDRLVAKGSSTNAKKKVVLREALDGGIVGAGVLAGMTDEIA